MSRTRFAPSPTGFLHLGHAFSALCAHHAGSGYVLRIDDIDHTRCRPHFTTAIYDDLTWLGLDWQGDPVLQSDRLAAYDAALEELRAADLLYPCFLTRAEITEILSAPHSEPGKPATAAPRTFGALSPAECNRRFDAGQLPAWRLHADKAMATAGPLTWHDAANLTDIPVSMQDFGDVVLGRKDIGTSYHLSVVVDDSMDEITLVTRGADLTTSTHVHRLLQQLLGLPTPHYWHHELIADGDGKRLAKRDHARAIRQFRDEGYAPADLFALMPAPLNLPQ